MDCLLLTVVLVSCCATRVVAHINTRRHDSATALTYLLHRCAS